MKTAIVHDWLTSLGGAEKVLQAMAQVLPSPIYTLVKNPKTVEILLGQNAMVSTSFIQNIPLSRKIYRHLLPLFPYAIEQFDLREYDLILSSSHAVAKGVLTHAEQLHICYCHSPMRYAWDLHHQYMQGLGHVSGFLAKHFLHRIRQWDVASVPRVDHFIANSHHVARRIQRNYGRESIVLYPPVATHLFNAETKKEGFYLTVSRLVPYKRIDLIAQAFSMTPHRRLVIIGDGPEMGKIKKISAPNIEILGHISDEEMRQYMQKAKAFVFAAEEDFGIVPVEAQAAGTPVIAFGKGGALETVVDGVTGVFFDEQTPPSMNEAVNQFEKMEFDPKAIQLHAQQFGEQRFKSQLQQIIKNKWEIFCENHHSCRR
ncbi:MAG: glycosyltransferase [Verrucomicrobia bacterium]|nr:glycosyltransferase [Verrucomicrobiota bacterium]